MRWVAVGLCVGAMVGCGGSHRVQPAAAVVPATDGGGPLDAGAPLDAAASVDRGATAVDGGAHDGSADASAAPGWGVATQAPFSCDPLPNAFFFPRPTAAVPGAYARCASFTDARASSLAVNADGRRVALVGRDGVARIVDVSSRTVVGVLAPPRATITRAAFSPAGDAILTVASGERLATLWRADTFTPIWTTVLPGHPYQGLYGGTAAFAPDGTTVLASTGLGLYLLDAATGAIRATRSSPLGVLGAAFGWGGRRIAVLDAPLTGMCNDNPHGGSVTLLDPATLTSIATPVTWGMAGDEGPDPGQMAVAADADLVVTTGPGDPHAAGAGSSAFRLSDGGSLPAPALSGVPLLLTPDGTAGLVAHDGLLQLERVTDGAVVAATTAAAPTAAAVSADGTAIAAGSSGADLLAIWRPADGSWLPTCSADRPDAFDVPMATALDATGSTVAVGWGTEVRLFRRTDGALLSTLHREHQMAYELKLSPDARYLLGEFDDHMDTLGFPIAVLRTGDGVQVADLGRSNSYRGNLSNAFWFVPAADRLDAVLARYPSWGLAEFDLEGGGMTPGVAVDGYIQGVSGGCALVAGPNATLFRECAGSPPVPLATDTAGGIVSMDGRAYLTSTVGNKPRATVLWRLTSQPAVVQSYPPRPEEATWDVSEVPLALSADGSRAVTTAQRNDLCGTDTPGFTARVHDVATGATVDDLPPYATGFSADLNVVAYTAVLWCVR